MRDEELARLILTEMQENPGPTGFRDMLEIARAHGVSAHYEPQRVCIRLQEEGYVEADPASPTLARLTKRGEEALASGDYEALTMRAISRLESGGRIAEAKESGQR